MEELSQQQGDRLTRWARPSIVYAGLFFVFLVHVALPIVAWIVLAVKGRPITENMPALSLPGPFWATWGSVTSLWVIGRSIEKRGTSSAAAAKAAKIITGGS